MDVVHVIDTQMGAVTVYKGMSFFGESPLYVIDEGWKRDEVRGSTVLISIPIEFQ
ncbi:hypothetical protein NKG99_14405 [Mesorhizobium sp. M1409]|uniref:hypothetical protein n=1 Tax=unclassified Mesorhizobium TaxID=325217 RepID=UPI003339E581